MKRKGGEAAGGEEGSVGGRINGSDRWVDVGDLQGEEEMMDGWMMEGEDGGEDRGVDGWMSRYITYCQRICFSLQFACYG